MTNNNVWGAGEALGINEFTCGTDTNKKRIKKRERT